MKENSNIQGLALSFARYVVEKKSKEMKSENRIAALFMPLSAEYADIVAAKNHALWQIQLSHISER